MKCPKCNFQWVTTQRSNKQNRYLHGVLFEMIAEEMGEWNLENVKDLMKEKFLREPVLIHTKKKTFQEYKIKGTSELDTREMMQFIERCRHWAREFLGINIPEPEEKDGNV